MNISKASEMLKAIFSQPERLIVPYLQGPPGVGKTAICEQTAAEMGLPLINFALPSCEAVDLRGLPQIVDGRTRWACPLPKEGRGVLILDEVASAPSDVQVAAHHIVWSQSGSEISIGPGWHIVLTGNRAQDKTFYRAMGSPLRNRIAMIEIEPDTEVTIKWMMNHNIHSYISGFLRWRPELLSAREIPSEGAFPSPRAWQHVSNIMHLAVDAEIESEMIRGVVGQGTHVEFMAYLRTARELPSIESIENNQDKAQVPTSPSVLYALITCLSQYTRQTKRSLARFVARCPAEFTLLYIRDVVGYVSLKSDPDIRLWIGKHKKLFAADSDLI